MRRAIRNPGLDRSDAALAAFTTFFLLTWAAYVFTLVRFPQSDGDPIKAHYLLFLAPVAGVFAACTARWAWMRSWPTQIALATWLLLYVGSYAAVLVTSFD